MRTIQLLDIIPGYACNAKCIFCAVTDDLRKTNLRPEALLARIDQSTQDYLPAKARIGGGEPTIRKDLCDVVRYLRSRGIAEVRLQTNGFTLCYDNFMERLADSGLTGINFSIPGFDDTSMTYLTGVPKAFDMVNQAIGKAMDKAMNIEIDILFTKLIVHRLEQIVAHYVGRGINKLNFWHIAIKGKTEQRINELVPLLSVATARLGEIIDGYPDADIRPYYMPYCFFPNHVEKVWHPADEDAYVITPEQSFFLEAGDIEMGQKTEKCAACQMASRCFGIRKEYITHFGTDEIVPLHQ